MREVRLEVGRAGSISGPADCCSAHGKRAVRRVDFALQSRTPPEGSRLLNANLLGVASRLADRAARVQVTQIVGWPLCRRCARRRNGLIVLAAVLFWGGLAAVGATLLVHLVTGAQGGALGAAGVAGLVAVPVSLVSFVLGSMPRITRARTSEDGSAVVVTEPHPGFTAAVQDRAVG
ncbi:hypothetical protein GCM10009854_22730 [Saccharopolyspora halophila]|uniref:Uncharacterized protein n=1 Tax=Saccharopolyspora halophila TaxID=405551 RepID=A0ABN3G6N5_9PSEU